MRRAGSGRVARKIGAYDDSADSASSSQKSIVKRPTFGKNKKRSSLRISFGPGESDGNDGDESSDAAIITPKKSNLSRVVIEKNAQLRARSPLALEHPRASLDEDRPTYSKDYLAELRNSTPSTPKDMKPSIEEKELSRALDIASKFGPSATLSSEVSAIPTEAEIQEKKARRRRLAREQNANDDDEEEEENRPWASDDDDEFKTSKKEISLRPKDKYVETRLTHDDEDIMEGFDDFVEDGKVSLGRKSEREAKRKRRAQMAELIHDAEGSSDDGSDDSEEERNAAFAAAQARAGTYSTRNKKEDSGARTPPRLPPIPDLDHVLENWHANIRADEQRRETLKLKLEELKEDESRIAGRKQFIQEELKKIGEEYEEMRQSSGMPALPTNGADGGGLVLERGLDSIGTTPLPGSIETSDNE